MNSDLAHGAGAGRGGPIERIAPPGGPWPLHDTAASRAAEQAALAAQPPQALMERAGLAVARLAVALAPHAGPVQVWAGPGNNGGDGLVAARHLHQCGRQVRVALLADAARLPADAAVALRQAQAAGVHIHAGLPPDDGPRCDSVIDALLGLGSNRAPAGAMAAAIAALNSGGAPVLSVDIPSGLHPDTGVPLGDAAVHAHATLALLTLKPGCLTGAGRDHAGALWLAALGSAPAQEPTAWLNGRPPALRRAHAAHKGSFGTVAVVGGAPGMVGAAWLAARAALAAGAGKVYCSPLDPAAPLLDAARPELMGRHAWWQSPPAQLVDTTVACGCGGGDAVRQALPPLLSHVRRLVLDADALNAIGSDAALQPLLRARAARALHTVLTPHPLEAARLLGSSAADVQHDRLLAAGRLAAAYHCTVLLKGSGSIVAAPGRLPMINATGNAALATAGTGDVLAGWIAGRWAQQPDADAADVVAAAAWQHGRAADLWLATQPTAPLRAADLVEALLHAERG